MPYIWAPKTPTLAIGRELHIDDTGQQVRAKAHITEQLTGGRRVAVGPLTVPHAMGKAIRELSLKRAGGGCC